MIVTESTDSRGGELYALTPAQRGLWFLAQTGDRGAYNIARARRIRGPLDLELLEESHRRVIARHEILRTRYVEKEGVPYQIVDPPGVGDFRVIDPPPGDIQGYLNREAEAEFDLTDDSMWRMRVVRIGPEDHVMLDVIHHIAADGWSLPTIRSETGAFYNALLEGREPDLPEAVQYRHAAHNGDGPADVATKLEYWRETLDPRAEPFALPYDRVTASDTTEATGFWLNTTVDDLSGSALSRFAASLGATKTTVGLALFAAALSRWARTDDIVIAVPATARRETGEGVVGPFFNSLPLRIEVDPEMAFSELVTQVRDQLLAAMENEVPFEELVREIDPVRTPGRLPIFNIMFQWREAAFREGYGLTNTTEENVPLHGGTAKFDLLLEVADAEDMVELSLNAKTGLFETATAQAFLNGVAEMMRQAIANPDGPLRTTAMASRAEIRRIMTRLADNARPLPEVSSLADEYERRVAGRDSDVAIHASRPISHAELLDAARKVEAELASKGVGEGHVVGMKLDRSATMFATVLAVNRLGAAYVPIDPEYPTSRIEQMIDIAGVSAMVTAIPGGSWDQVRVDELALAQPVQTPTERLAYIMFTSGSTGQPKGVMVGERAVLRLVSTPDYVNLGPGDVVAHMSNVAFDAATFEIWGPLLNGASIAIIDKETALSPDDLEARLDELGVSTIFVTTALFNALSRQRPALFAGVRDVLFGGERCDTNAVRSVMEAGPPRRLVHVYGPTETTTFASWYELPQDEPTKEGPVPDPVPIGGPIVNTALYVLDAWGAPMPPGLVGELHIGGPGVATGYAANPEETRSRFVPDPFSDDPWGRMYRTGDLVKVNETGDVVFVGRADRQVKLRGFRIELAEIESALMSHDWVDAAVVRLVDDANPRLVAWVVAGRSDVTEHGISNHLQSTLPGFMIPTDIVVVPELPIGPTGKIDPGLLPSQQPTGSEDRAMTPTESQLVALFEEILGVSEVGRTDDFFDLGGHSIGAVELVSLIDRRLGKRLGVAEMMERPTPEGIAARIDTGDFGDLERRLVAMASGTGDPVFVFHHPSGTVQAYSNLARMLPDGVRVIGVNASGVDGTIHPSEDLGEMATEYASLLQSAHPLGDFQLIGHSLGGLLAWETARQLEEAGRGVVFLGLIDTQLPGRYDLRSVLTGLPGSLRHVGGSVYRRAHRLLGDLRWGSKRRWLEWRGRPIPADLARVALIRASTKAFDSYHPTPVGVDISYFLATGRDGEGGKMQEGWFDLSPHIDVARVPGMHSGPESILHPPHVEFLAKEVSLRLPVASQREGGR